MIIGQRMMGIAWKGYLKTFDRWNSQRLYSQSRNTHKWGLPLNPTTICRVGSTYKHNERFWLWPSYSHKTQSFVIMKNEGQQKCWDKALILYLCCGCFVFWDKVPGEKNSSFSYFCNKKSFVSFSQFFQPNMPRIINT